MKIIWWGIWPWSPTAYGKIANYLPRELEKQGHEVHIFCGNGLHAGRFTINGLRVYGNNTPGIGVEAVLRLFKELKADVVLYMADTWPYATSLASVGSKVPLILHSPIDHFPVTMAEIETIKKAKILVSPSKIGVTWAQQAGISNVTYAPHGFNPEIFRTGDKMRARRQLKWPQTKFIYLNVATNKGDRKNHYGLFRAYSNMLQRKPSLRDHVVLAMHTYPYRDLNNQEGYELWNIAAELNVQTEIIWSEPGTYLEGLPESQLALMYQAADVLVLPSKTEGFGMPLIEAGACGLPAITTNFASMSELVGDRGYLIDVAEMEVQQLLGYAWQSIPSTDHLSQIMEMVQEYEHEHLLQIKGRKMKEYCDAEFTWEKAGSYWPAILENI